MTRLTWIAAIVLLAAALVWLIGAPDRRDATPAGQSALDDEPDLYMEDTTISQYNDDGTPRYKLVAATIRHFEHNDVTRIEAPALELYRSGDAPWSLRARMGTIRYVDRPDGTREEQVTLEQAVRLEQTHDGGFTRVETEAIDIYPERRFAATDRAVMIESNAGRTTAVGLTADLGAGLLTLSSSESQRVHTTVLPNQFRRATARPST
jgi:lipopolysaccharide export system protein LptC